MRNLMNIKLFVLMAALLLGVQMATAYDFEEGGIYYNVNDDGTTVTVTYKWTDWDNYNDSLLYGGDVTIPATVTYNGTTYSVSTIGESAFYNCIGLTSIDIPNSVTTIGEGAFDGCISLTSIDIPNSVTTIGELAFGGCTGLTNMAIPNSVTTIGNLAFHNCSGLTSFTLPNSVTTFGEDDILNPLCGCSGLTSITVDPGNIVYDSRDNCNAIIKTATNMMLSGCQATVIPRSVTGISAYSFCNCVNLTSIFIPNTITSITGIGDYYVYGLFGGCDNLASIIVENGNPVYDSRDNCNAIIETATNTLIAGCGNSVIPNTVTAIGCSAFGGCMSLSSINFPPSVKTIGSYSFSICSLTEVTIGEGVDSIADFAFRICPNLKKLDLGSVVYIGQMAFSGCTGLSHVTIPNSFVSAQSYYAHSWFYNCLGLTSVTIGSGMAHMGLMFWGCPNITKVTNLAITPPITDLFMTEGVIASNFTDEVYEQATLYVPVGSVEDYKVARYWKNFQNIRPLGDSDGNGDLGISDVSSLIDYLLTEDANGMDLGAADADGNGKVEIADLSVLIDMLLNL